MRRIGSNIRRQNTDEKAKRPVRNIIRYTDDEDPRNDYPRRIISPSKQSKCCVDDNRVMVGSVRDLTFRATGNVERSVRSVTDTIVSRIGDAVDLRMTRLLNAFQIPTSRDLHELTERVERLTRELAATRAKPAARRRSAPRKTTGHS